MRLKCRFSSTAPRNSDLELDSRFFFLSLAIVYIPQVMYYSKCLHKFTHFIFITIVKDKCSYIIFVSYAQGHMAWKWWHQDWTQAGDVLWLGCIIVVGLGAALLEHVRKGLSTLV